MAKKKMMWFDWLAYVLLIISALNWGFVQFLEFNAVTALSLGFDAVEMVIYGLVFGAGVYGAIMAFKITKK